MIVSISRKKLKIIDDKDLTYPLDLSLDVDLMIDCANAIAGMKDSFVNDKNNITTNH